MQNYNHGRLACYFAPTVLRSGNSEGGLSFGGPLREPISLLFLF